MNRRTPMDSQTTRHPPRSLGGDTLVSHRGLRLFTVSVIIALGVGRFSAASPDDWSLDVDHVGRVYLDMTQKDFYAKTYDSKQMENPYSDLDRDRSAIDIYLHDDSSPRLSADPTGYFLLSHLRYSRRIPTLTVLFNKGKVVWILVRDERFRMKDGLHVGSTLGELRRVFSSIKIENQGEVYESTNQGNMAKAYHPTTTIGNLRFGLEPKEYLKYRPGDLLADDTLVLEISVGNAGPLRHRQWLEKR